MPHRPILTVLLLLAPTGHAQQQKPIHAEVIESFESDTNLRAWTLRDVKGTLSTDHATEGQRSARLHYPQWKEGMGLWPASIVDHGRGGFRVRDWSRFEKLLFDVYSATDQQTTLKLRLDDATGKRWTRAFAVPSKEPFTVEVPISSLSIDTTQVVHFDLYMTKPAIDTIYFVDHIRLEAYPLTVEEAKLVPDVFGAGKVGVAGCKLSRAGTCQIEIANSVGHVVARHQELTQVLNWQWDGLANGKPAPPGRYQAVLKVTDTAWGKGTAPLRELGLFDILPPDKQPQAVAWYEPTTQKVMLHDRPVAGRTILDWADLSSGKPGLPPLRIDMCRNEYEGAQVVWLTRERRMKLRFAIEGLRHAQSNVSFPMARSTIYQVGYVETQDPKTYKVDFIGWWPDPLLPTEEMFVEPGECMPIWISLKSEPDTQPGPYRGRLGVWADRERVGSLPLEVHVHDAIVPRTTTVRTTFSTYNGMIAKIYGGELTPQMWRKYQELIADHRVNPDSIYRSSPPPIEDVDYFTKRGQLNAFNLMYLRRSDKKHLYDAAHLQRIASVLDPYVAELRKRGLADKAYIYGFDEVGPDQYPAMRRAFSFLKQRYPEIPTITTGRDHSFGIDSGLDDVVDIWVPLTPRYDLERAEAARARGKEVWWYICCGPRNPYANWFVEYTALEPRLLWWMTYQHKVPGFLYYTMSRWPLQKEPLRIDGHNKTNWNPASYKTFNGDGSLFCGGPDGPITTVRFENVRDGIEDHELLQLLAQRLQDDGKESRSLCNELIPTLTTFTRDARKFAEVRQRLLKRLAGGMTR